MEDNDMKPIQDVLEKVLKNILSKVKEVRND